MTDPSLEVAAVAPPNRLAADDLRVRPSADGSLSIDPARAGWRYLSFATRGLGSGDSVDVGGDGREWAAVVVAGGGVAAELAGTEVGLEGRATPFDGLPWAIYLPPGTSARLSGVPIEPDGRVLVAILASPPGPNRDVASEPVVIRPADVEVEIRGAGGATRQINHIIKPDFPAHRLLAVEVLTPSGNWSSWPPHKHDVDDMPAEAVLEEVYCYQFRRAEGWGVQRVYRRPGTPAAESSGPRDAVWAVRGGEVVLVTDGYHPFAATEGDDAYYLNALAGDRRTMACSFDPDLDWVRASGESEAADDRLPLVGRAIAGPTATS